MARMGIAKSCLPIAILLASGCANTPEIRDLAERTGVFVTSLDEETSDFLDAQNRLNAENEEHLSILERHAGRLKARVAQQQLASTRAGATTALATQAAATAVTAEQVVAQLDPTASEPAIIAFEGSAGYQKASKALVEIGTEPSLTELLTGLLAFAGAVRDAHADLVAKAKEDAAAAGAGTAEATAEAIGGGAAAVEEE